jgi:hypothetical protein
MTTDPQIFRHVYDDGRWTELQVRPTERAPRPDIPLMRKVFDHIKVNQELWNQENWAVSLDRDVADGLAVETDHCGTAYCFAGWVAALDGYTHMAYTLDISESGPDARRILPQPHEPPPTGASTALADDDGWTVNVSDYAQARLGLNNYWASGLFDGDNTLKDLEEIINLMERAEIEEVEEQA